MATLKVTIDKKGNATLEGGQEGASCFALGQKFIDALGDEEYQQPLIDPALEMDGVEIYEGDGEG